MCFNCNLPGLHDEDFVPMVESSAIFFSPLPKLCLVAVASSSSSSAHLEQSSRERKKFVFSGGRSVGSGGACNQFSLSQEWGVGGTFFQIPLLPEKFVPMHFPRIFGKGRGKRTFYFPTRFRSKKKMRRKRSFRASRLLVSQSLSVKFMLFQNTVDIGCRIWRGRHFGTDQNRGKDGDFFPKKTVF